MIRSPRESVEIEKKAATVPPKFRALYRRAMLGKSRKDAMEAFCAECMGWSSEECESEACPHYSFRGVHRR